MCHKQQQLFSRLLSLIDVVGVGCTQSSRPHHLHIVIHLSKQLRLVPEIGQQQGIQQAHAAGYQVEVLHGYWGPHHASGHSQHRRHQPLKHALQHLPALHHKSEYVQ